MKEYKYTASIVLFKPDIESIIKLVDSISISKIDIIYLIDNSPENNYNYYKHFAKVEYYHFPYNPGFGSAHNIAFHHAFKSNSNFHFVINPDIIVSASTINDMLDFIVANENVGMIMPKILNQDGTIQYLPKLIPNIFMILLRKVNLLQRIFPNTFSKYEMRDANENLTLNLPILSGCFSLFNTNVLLETGGYDENYFMYFEDWDLSRRIHEKYKTLYLPSVSVIHEYYSGANKNIKLLKIYINSLITYFNKWGWFFDKKRNLYNKQALCQIN